jgi:HTH-type transcriptional regulator/antitoxin MqsA
MNPCHVCGNTQFREEIVSEIFQIDGKTVLVENIPARVCERCGEPTDSRETTEKIRRMVHGEAEPIRTIRMEVFAYA